MESVKKVRVRYPFKAIVAVAAAALLFLFDVTVGFLFMAMVPPLIPIYVCVVFGAGCLMMSAVQYAQRVSLREPASMLRAAPYEGQVARHALTAP